MANDFPDPIVPPDPNGFGIGQKLLAETANRFQDLGESFNYGHAWFGASTLVAQGFDASLASSSAAMPGAATYHSLWRVPKLGAAWTSVECEIRATKAGAGDGTVRFQSINGGATLNVAVAAGTTGWFSGTLNVGYHADGYEQIDMTIAGAGGAATTVHEVMINYVPLTSPLAASGSDGFTPFDAEEINADSVCSADVGIAMRNNLRAFLGDSSDLATYPGRKRVAFNWSDLGSLKSGMTNAEHRCLRPVNYDALANAHALTVYVNATGVAGASKIRLYLGHERPGHPSGTSPMLTTIDVGAGAARAWYSTTISLDDGHRILRDLAHPSTYLSVWPGTRDYGQIGNFGPQRAQNDGVASPTIHAVSAWSY